MDERLFCQIHVDESHTVGCGVALHERDITHWEKPSLGTGWVYFQCPKCFLESRHFKWQVDEKRDKKEQYELRERNGKKLFLEDVFSTTVYGIHQYNQFEAASSEVMNVLGFIQKEVINTITV